MYKNFCGGEGGKAAHLFLFLVLILIVFNIIMESSSSGQEDELNSKFKLQVKRRKLSNAKL